LLILRYRSCEVEGVLHGHNDHYNNTIPFIPFASCHLSFYSFSTTSIALVF